MGTEASPAPIIPGGALGSLPACQADDEYTFTTANTFTYDAKAETFVAAARLPGPAHLHHSLHLWAGIGHGHRAVHAQPSRRVYRRDRAPTSVCTAFCPSTTSTWCCAPAAAQRRTRCSPSRCVLNKCNLPPISIHFTIRLTYDYTASHLHTPHFARRRLCCWPWRWAAAPRTRPLPLPLAHCPRSAGSQRRRQPLRRLHRAGVERRIRRQQPSTPPSGRYEGRTLVQQRAAERHQLAATT